MNEKRRVELVCGLFRSRISAWVALGWRARRGARGSHVVVLEDDRRRLVRTFVPSSLHIVLPVMIPPTSSLGLHIMDPRILSDQVGDSDHHHSDL
jgi:hypothetical protein